MPETPSICPSGIIAFYEIAVDPASSGEPAGLGQESTGLVETDTACGLQVHDREARSALRLGRKTRPAEAFEQRREVGATLVMGRRSLPGRPVGGNVVVAGLGHGCALRSEVGVHWA